MHQISFKKSQNFSFSRNLQDGPRAYLYFSYVLARKRTRVDVATFSNLIYVFTAHQCHRQQETQNARIKQQRDAFV
jgi:hypothetical protein